MPHLLNSHRAAPNRPRRMEVQYDAHGQLGAPFDESKGRAPHVGWPGSFAERPLSHQPRTG